MNSLRRRVQVNNSAVSKLRRCVRQFERLNLNGSSNEDIAGIFHYKNKLLICKYLTYIFYFLFRLKQAKLLLEDDPLYRKGF